MEEGEEALEDAINFLENQKKLEPLIWCTELERIALDHVKYLGPRGLMQDDRVSL